MKLKDAGFSKTAQTPETGIFDPTCPTQWVLGHLRDPWVGLGWVGREILSKIPQYFRYKKSKNWPSNDK